MADTREIECTLVPKEPKGDQICGNTPMYACERQMAELMLMLPYVNSAIPLSGVLEAPQTSQSIRSDTISYHYIISFVVFFS